MYGFYNKLSRTQREEFGSIYARAENLEKQRLINVMKNVGRGLIEAAATARSGSY